MNGVLVLDKPEGFTSFDAVALMRRLCGERKAGHTGTLDPMATGVLPILLGSGTKAIPFLADNEKEYEASFSLGVRMDTGDRTGTPVARSEKKVTREELEKSTAGVPGGYFANSAHVFGGFGQRPAAVPVGPQRGGSGACSPSRAGGRIGSFGLFGRRANGKPAYALQ